MKYILIILLLLIGFLTACNGLPLGKPSLTPTAEDDPNVMAAKERMHRDLLAEETRQQWIRFSGNLIMPLIAGLVGGIVLIGIKFRRFGGSLAAGCAGGLLAIVVLVHASKPVASIIVGFVAVVAVYVLYLLWVYRKALVQVVLGNEEFKKSPPITTGNLLKDFKIAQRFTQSPQTEAIVDKIRGKGGG